MSGNEELIKKLKDYSFSRKGEIAKLTYDAAVAISDLSKRVEELERQLNERV